MCGRTPHQQAPGASSAWLARHWGAGLRPRVLSLIALGAAFAASCARGAPPARTLAPASLRAAAAAKGLFYGCAVHRGLVSDTAFQRAVVTDCGMLVPENALKWRELSAAPGRYDFGLADAIAEFATAHGLALRGHALVFHSSMPAWFAATADSANAERLLVDHITTVAGRYRGRMHSWDVVNEAIDVRSPRPDRLRVQPWLALLGPGYIETAFRAAHAADPNALLVYNEAEVDHDGAQQDTTRRATLALLDRLLATGTPVHALGIQMHLDDSSRFTALPAFLAAVKARGLAVIVTEMDVRESNAHTDPAAIDSAVAAAYRRGLDVVLGDPGVVRGVLTWGLSDRYSWRTVRPRPDGRWRRPLPLDAELRRKAAWRAIVDALAAAPAVP